MFDLFKKNAMTTSIAKKVQNGSSLYATSGQMRMANLAGKSPSTFIKAHANYSHLRTYMNKCKEILVEKKEIGVKIATGLQKEILQKLDLDYDETSGEMLDVEAQELLRTKTNGISSFTIEMLHYGFNIELEKLIDIDRKSADNILSQMRKEFGYDESEPILTDDKFTWHFDKDLYSSRFGENTDPFKKKEKEIGKIYKL